MMAYSFYGSTIRVVGSISIEAVQMFKSLGFRIKIIRRKNRYYD